MGIQPVVSDSMGQQLQLFTSIRLHKFVLLVSLSRSHPVSLALLAFIHCISVQCCVHWIHLVVQVFSHVSRKDYDQDQKPYEKKEK